MKKLKITQQKFTLIDDDMHRLLSKYKWYAVKNKRNWYVGRTISVNGKKRNLFMHRVIMGLSYKDNLIVDHIDDNGLNNQKSNLRVTTNKLNVANKRKNTGKHYSKYKGVTYDKVKKKYVVNMFYTKNGNRKSKHVGYFNNQKEAGKAYDKWAIKWYGKFARLNFPLVDEA